MRQLLELEGPAKLPDEMQWAIRMLLPRPKGSLPFAQGPGAPPAGTPHIAAGGPAIAGGPPPDALALLAQHAQQVR